MGRTGPDRHGQGALTAQATVGPQPTPGGHGQQPVPAGFVFWTCCRPSPSRHTQPRRHSSATQSVSTQHATGPGWPNANAHRSGAGFCGPTTKAHYFSLDSSALIARHRSATQDQPGLIARRFCSRNAASSSRVIAPLVAPGCMTHRAPRAAPISRQRVGSACSSRPRM